MDRALRQAADLLADASILVFTGAGISTESGIPDFRGPDGLWTKMDPEDFTIARYLANEEVRRRSWQLQVDSPLRNAVPNAAHRAIMRLWEAERLVGCVTQNIDGLHLVAGLPSSAVVELHGNVREVRCLGCGSTWPAEEVLERVRSGEGDPRCPQCGDILKLTVVSFGELLPVGAMARAHAMASVADAALAVGTTLSVFPAAYVPLEAADRGAPLIIVNQGPTEMDHLARVKLDGPAGTLLPALVDLILEAK